MDKSSKKNSQQQQQNSRKGADFSQNAINHKISSSSSRNSSSSSKPGIQLVDREMWINRRDPTKSIKDIDGFNLPEKLSKPSKPSIKNQEQNQVNKLTKVISDHKAAIFSYRHESMNNLQGDLQIKTGADGKPFVEKKNPSKMTSDSNSNNQKRVRFDSKINAISDEQIQKDENPEEDDGQFKLSHEYIKKRLKLVSSSRRKDSQLKNMAFHMADIANYMRSHEYFEKELESHQKLVSEQNWRMKNIRNRNYINMYYDPNTKSYAKNANANSTNQAQSQSQPNSNANNEKNL